MEKKTERRRRQREGDETYLGMVAKKKKQRLVTMLECDEDDARGASYASASHNVGHGADINTSLAHQKVNLSVYYDSLCKTCAKFIIEDLRDIFGNNLISIVNLQLVPWANAYVNNTNKSISCQDIQYQFVNCFEFLAIKGTIKEWKEECLNQLGLPKEPFLNCFNMGNGTEPLKTAEPPVLTVLHRFPVRFEGLSEPDDKLLGKTYINQIAQLDPPPSFVPWVVVNNQPVEKDYANFAHYVCKAYRGVVVPGICNTLLK
ncbi:hypothetical protein JHK85_006553 [Glycine max]|nr:hypothetical protein JHK85_006553 [Glycine max]